MSLVPARRFSPPRNGERVGEIVIDSPTLVARLTAGLYQSSLIANCICRGVLACEVITPKVVEVTLVLGEPNRGVLKALSASTRN